MEVLLIIVVIAGILLVGAASAATWIHMELKKSESYIFCSTCGDVKPPPRRGGSVCDECGLAGYGGTDDYD